MKRIAALLLLSASGCRGFAEPSDDQIRLLNWPPASASALFHRLRVHLSLDSAWLAGEFDGVVVAREEAVSPVVRIQLFGDLGPKMMDLVARRDRIVGYFPQAHEGIDCSLPSEASPHPLLFMGASLVEQFTPRTRDRLIGVREEERGLWLRLRPSIEGTTSLLFRDPSGSTPRRRLSWMYGVSWEEEWVSPDECRIVAPRLSLRVRILEREERPAKPADFELKLPEDVRISPGSRK